MSDKQLTVKKIFDSPYVLTKFEAMLGDRASAFVTSVLSVANNNSMLSQADPQSILNAAMTAASLDLPVNPNLGFSAIVPFKDSRQNKVVAQYQIMWRGYVQLAQRSGQFKTINVTDVREGELGEFDRLSGEIEFNWLSYHQREKASVIGYVAYFALKNGFEKMLYMPVDQLKKHGKKYSQSYKSGRGLWEDDFTAMAQKTVLKLLLSRFGPLSTDERLAKAQLSDQAAGGIDGQYIDNGPLIASDVAAQKERDRIIDHIQNANSMEQLEQCREAIDPADAQLMAIFDAKLTKLEAQG